MSLAEETLARFQQRRAADATAAAAAAAVPPYLGLLRDAVAGSSSPEVVQFLLQHGAVPEEDMLSQAVSRRSVEKVQLLLEYATFGRACRRQAVVDAIRLHAADMVKVLLTCTSTTADFPVEQTVEQGTETTTPLHYAMAQEAPLSLIRLLVQDGGARINATNDHAQTCLHMIPGGDAQAAVARYLLEQGANPDLADKDGQSTALHYAAYRGHRGLVKVLLRHGAADPAATDIDNRTALHDAIEQNHVAIAKDLVAAFGGVLSQRTETPFFSVVKFVPEDDDDNNDNDDNDDDNDEDTFMMPNFLIQTLGVDPWDPDKAGNTALHFAVAQPLDTESDDDDDNDDEKELPGGERRLEFLKELVEHDAALLQAKNYKGLTPLHVAAGWSVVLTQTLVTTYHADSMATDVHGHTPLIHAILTGTAPRIIKSLLILMKERDMNLNMPDKQGWNALHWATFLEIPAVVRLLLEFGASPNAVNSQGRTPLHLVGFPFCASREDHSYSDADVTRILTVPFPKRRRLPESNANDSVMDLLNRAADATHVDAAGNLPFFMASSTGQVDVPFLMIRAAAARGLFGNPATATAGTAASMSKRQRRSSSRSNKKTKKKPRKHSSVRSAPTS